MTSAKFCRATFGLESPGGAPFSCTTLSVIAILSMYSFASDDRLDSTPFLPESGCKVTPFSDNNKIFPVFFFSFNRI